MVVIRKIDSIRPTFRQYQRRRHKGLCSLIGQQSFNFHRPKKPKCELVHIRQREPLAHYALDSAENGTDPKMLTPLFERPTDMSLPYPMPKQQFTRGSCFGATFSLARQAISQWGWRVRTRNEPTTINDADPHHIRRTRAKVEAERC
jgi:hypothetical protein